jgi:hypothetical protein
MDSRLRGNDGAEGRGYLKTLDSRLRENDGAEGRGLKTGFFVSLRTTAKTHALQANIHAASRASILNN